LRAASPARARASPRSQVDRHVNAGRGDAPAIIWEGDEPGSGRTLTFSQVRVLRKRKRRSPSSLPVATFVAPP
jgi:hypothetical protein